MRKLTVGCLVACALAVCGCGRREPGTVEQLAQALRECGVAYDVSETAALSGIPCEGLRLTGQGLVLEIFRIAEEGRLRLATSAAALAAQAETQRGDAQPLRFYLRKSFLVIVRREPSEGTVAAALEQVFGG